MTRRSKIDLLNNPTCFLIYIIISIPICCHSLPYLISNLSFTLAMIIDLELTTSLLCLFFTIITLSFLFKPTKKPTKLPKSYPFIGSILAIRANSHRRIQWLSDVLQSMPTGTFVLERPLGKHHIFTANPANVQHMLKTNFQNYQKGPLTHDILFDFLGNGIFNADGPTWKFQRQVASHQFNTKSLREFVDIVVETELSDRLIPIFAEAAKNGTVLDLQDILQRFAFDNICRIAFGYDPAYLLPSLPDSKFATSFEAAVRISSERVNNSVHPLAWKIRKVLNLGSEKQLKAAVKEVRDLAKEIVREKKQNPDDKSVDMLSRFLSSGHSDEDFVVDIVISFILAGRDTTSAALVWFFWLVHNHPSVEKNILGEINEKSESNEGTVYEEVKDMAYIHACLSESMRFYPPVPVDGKYAMDDDVLPDGTTVKKGMRVAYHPYAMGRSERLWGPDYNEFRPERFLQRELLSGRWSYVAKDMYTYAVFQAGPRVCLGKEMAYLQMKRVAAGVLKRFRVVPAMEEGCEPVFISYLTSKMKGGFPVRIEERRR